MKRQNCVYGEVTVTFADWALVNVKKKKKDWG